MMIKKMGKIVVTALGFVAVAQGSVAADNSMQGQQVNEKWTMTLDEGQKQLDVFSPFMTFEPADKSKIVKIRFDIGSNRVKVLNLFLDVQQQDSSAVAMTPWSAVGLYLSAANQDEHDKVKEVIDSINNQKKAEYEAEKAQRFGSHMSSIFAKHTTVRLPFTFADKHQPNCFFAVLDFSNYKYLGIFLDQFQTLYPDLKSDVLDQGYMEIVRRISNS